MTHKNLRTRPDWVSDELFPFESRFIDIDGHVLHYVDEGEGPVLLMVHGNPTWSFLYREVIEGLRDGFRCVAFDHPGFGLSTAGEDYGFTYAEHTDVAAQFVEALELEDITLFVQDWGGPIGLGVASRQAKLYRALIVGNTFAWPSDQLLWNVTSRVLGGPLGRELVGRTNWLARSVAGAHKRTNLTSEETHHYAAPYPDRGSRKPHNVFLRQITAARTELTELAAMLGNLEHLPTLIVWGDKDPFFKSSDRARIEDLFPNHTSHVLTGAGHFIQDDASEELVRCIKEWWKASVQE